MLKIGTQVRMTSLDKYGFTGRDRHPEACHVGAFAGTVVEAYDVTPDDEERCYAYLVCDRAGNLLELMHDEVTAEPATTYVVTRLTDPREDGCPDVTVGLATDAKGVFKLLTEAEKAGHDWSVFEVVGHKAVRRAVTFEFSKVKTGCKIS